MPETSQTVTQRTVRFGDFELRLDQSTLLQRGRKLKLQPQPFRVLAYLVARAPSIVNREELGEHIWSDGVHVDLDQSLNYCIRQIRQVLDDDATLPQYVETLPRQGYRFIFPVDAVVPPPAALLPERKQEDQLSELSLSTAEDSSMSLNHVEDQPDPASVLPAPGRGLRTIVGLSVLILFVLLLAAGKKLLRSWLPVPHIGSLAVLPLENLSGDPGQEYLADGMTDELITMLAKDSSLRIVSRTSVMQFKGARRPLPEIARELGVDAVIEGSLARSGTRMHMTLQLIRGDTDSHLWAESYNRDVNDPTLSDEAARSIAQHLNSTVKQIKPTRIINPAAHDAYLRGRYLWPTDRMEESGAYFRKATEIQPDYAEAWAGLADFYGEGIAGGVFDPRTNMHLEEEAAERALTLAPNLALSHRAKAAAYLIDRWDAKSADREILLAISLDPNDAVSFYLRANILEALNRFPEAVEVEKKSMEMDPFERREGLASIYLYAHQYDEALADVKVRIETAPNDTGLLDTAAQAWRSEGNYEQAMKMQARLYVVSGDPKSAADLRRAFAQGGAKGMIRWQLERLLKEAKNHYVSPVQLASCYAQLGDREHALSLLEEGYRQRSTDVLWVPGKPEYEFLHADGRYQMVVQHLAASPIP